ncbi:isoprenylcysteine carboxylmethyltransferase family protein [Aeoliella sp. ICT_H6.2]|uniref:Isoprenylcysteine carboxylmethyltransferase family protein n=1 Tax=Aeoliella straminimaris TaxID=2954799 RepID=A0A9X2JHB4_9BACT|nr:isoprenylcysteine carboxylmethyltransferase family protein [Aeoliella straminimaris]MCO6042734.1 isoprenylcysteine carboxylmethyltransferase family protein [Aeoliella straminimaris]
MIVSLIGFLIYSIVRPENRVWPPPGQQTWQYVLVWLLTILAFAGFVVVGVLDWNSLGWPVMFRWPIGSVLIVGGNVLAWVGVRQLSLKTTSGSKGPLVTDGLYRYSRNPQYLGDIAIISGWAILSASYFAIPLCLGAIIAFAITPLAEEPWLQEIHGDIYREYFNKVPRFLGLPALE